MTFARAALLALAATLPAAVAAAQMTVEPWPAADRLFRSDERWVGGRGATSVDMGDERSMWFFYDCRIEGPQKRGQRASTIDNAIAIQEGANPATATIEFSWRARAGKPAEFFPHDGETIYQPTHGVLLDDHVLVFMTAITGGQPAGWSAAVITPHGGRWRTQLLTAPKDDTGVIVGTGGATLIGQHVYAFGTRLLPAGDNPAGGAYVARWLARDVAFGDLSQMQWWTGDDNGWVERGRPSPAPRAVVEEVAPGFSVHYAPVLDRFLMIVDAYSAPRRGLRLSWWGSEYLNKDWRHEENPAGASGKRLAAGFTGHPQLTGADLVLTRVDESGAVRFFRATVNP